MKRNHILNTLVILERLDILVILVALAILSSCTPTPRDVQKSDQLPPIYPDYCNVTIPENIAPLNFLLRADCEAIQVQVGDMIIHTRGNEVTFDMDEWKELLAKNAGRELVVSITALINNQWTEYKSFTWMVAKDKIDPFLTYRLIEPDYEVWHQVNFMNDVWRTMMNGVSLHTRM